MARNPLRYFRFYAKKRGKRRTGSELVGSAGLALFFAVFLAIGIGLFTNALGTLIVPEWRLNRHFHEQTCVLLDKRRGEKDDAGARDFRPEFLIAYTVLGQTYKRWAYDLNWRYTSSAEQVQQVLDRFETNEHYPCWYDPNDPKRVVLVRGYTWSAWLLLLVPASFVIFGGIGLSYTLLTRGKSAERRAAMVHRASALAPFDAAVGAVREFPTVPVDANLTDSPGIQLAYRLPMTSSPGWKLVATLTATAAANAVVAVFVVMAVNNHLRGEPDWLLTIFTLPLIALGMASIVYSVRQILLANAIGATCVEISAHPLKPGEEYQAFLSQGGRMKAKRLELLLVCEEKATFRQGTNTRTDTRRVMEEKVFQGNDLEIHPSAPFEKKCPFHVPAHCMHSFKADHNEINWQLVVRARVAGWRDFERSFPVVVYPPHDGKPQP